MAKRSSQRRLGPHAIKPVIIGVLSLGVAWAAYSNAHGNNALYTDPAGAEGEIGFGDFPRGQMADALLKTNIDTKTLPAANQLARSSVLAQAINPQALRVMGFEQDREGHSAKALELISLSDQLSRRDIGTQAWLVNHAVASGNIAEGLRHYDAALRVSNEVQPLLFATLTKGLGNAEVREAFVPYVKNAAPWLPSFIGYSLGASGDPAAAVNVILQAGGLPRTDRQYREYEAQLIQGLARTKQFDLLRRYFVTLPGAHPEILTSASFLNAATAQTFQPIAWRESEEASISSAFEDGGENGQKRLHVMANTGERGMAATKLTLLSPGHYQLTARLTTERGGKGATVAWQVACARSGGGLALVNAGTDVKSVSAEFDLPAECGGVILTLMAAGGDRSDGAEFFIDDVQLVEKRAPQERKPG